MSFTMPIPSKLPYPKLRGYRTRFSDNTYRTRALSGNLFVRLKRPLNDRRNIVQAGFTLTSEQQAILDAIWIFKLKMGASSFLLPLKFPAGALNASVQSVLSYEVRQIANDVWDSRMQFFLLGYNALTETQLDAKLK